MRILQIARNYQPGGGLMIALGVSLAFLWQASPHAATAIEPANVLVLYNADDGSEGDGAQIAQYYQEARPGVHLFGLTGINDVLYGPTDEAISADDYLSVIRPQVQSAIAAIGDSIDVIVTTKGLPLLVDTNPGDVVYPDPYIYCSASSKQYSSLESELTRIDSISTVDEMLNQSHSVGLPHYDTSLASNPYYDTNSPFNREGSDPVNGDIRLAARLDGYSVQEVKDAIYRAQHVYVVPQKHYVIVDDDPTAGTDQMVDMDPGGPGPGLVSVLDTHGEARLYEDTDEAIVNLIDPDTGWALGTAIGYVSHGTKDGPAGLTTGYIENQLEFGLAAGAVFLTHESFNARSFDPSYSQTQGLIAQWIERGGTAGLGHVEEPCNGPDNVTNEDLLFDMLLPPDGEPGSSGLTLVEAAWNATRQLSYVNTVVGDPLMTWSILTPGDFNLDGSVNLADVGPFIQSVINPGMFDPYYIDVLGDLDANGRFDLGDTGMFSQLFAPPPPIRGDMNGDDVVNLADVELFILALVNPTAYESDYPSLDRQRRGDVNGDGTFDLGDLAAFSALFAPPPPVRGDMNGDDVVNLADVDLFILALVNPTAYESDYPSLDWQQRGDVNGDGAFDLGDLRAFGDLFSASSQSQSLSVVPEPDSLTIAVLFINALTAVFRRPQTASRR